ncbi:platelet binding protein GspB-like [Clytia hemisphaerica]
MKDLIWIVFLCSVLSIARAKDYKCESSDTLKNVYLENEDDARSHVLHNVHTMSACVEKCCQNSTCDLALIKDDECHLIGCKDENSCQLSHSKDVDAEVTFLTNRKKEDVTKVQTLDVPPKKPGNKTSSLTSTKQSTQNTDVNKKLKSKTSKGVKIKQSSKQQDEDQMKQIPDQGDNTHQQDKLSDKNSVDLKVNDGKIEGVEKNEDEGSTDEDESKPGEDEVEPEKDETKPGEDEVEPEKDETKPGEDEVEPEKDETKPGEDEAEPEKDEAKSDAENKTTKNVKSSKDSQKQQSSSTAKTDGFQKDGARKMNNKKIYETSTSEELDNASSDDEEDDSSSDGSADDDNNVEINQSYDVTTKQPPLTTTPMTTVANVVQQHKLGYAQQPQQGGQGQQTTPPPSFNTSSNSPTPSTFQQNVQFQQPPQSTSASTTLAPTTTPISHKAFQQNSHQQTQQPTPATTTITPTTPFSSKVFQKKIKQKFQQQNQPPTTPAPTRTATATTRTATATTRTATATTRTAPATTAKTPTTKLTNYHQPNLNSQYVIPQQSNYSTKWVKSLQEKTSTYNSYLNQNNFNSQMQPNQTTSTDAQSNRLTYQTQSNLVYKQNKMPTTDPYKQPSIQETSDINLMSHNLPQSKLSGNEVPLVKVNTPALKGISKSPPEINQYTQQAQSKNHFQATNRYQQKTESKNQNKAASTISQYGYEAETQQTPTKYASGSTTTPYTNLPGVQGVPYKPTSAQFVSASTSTTTKHPSAKQTKSSWNSTPNIPTKYMPNVDETSRYEYNTTPTSNDNQPTEYSTAKSSTTTSTTTEKSTTTNYLPNVEEFSGDSNYEPTSSSNKEKVRVMNEPTPKELVSGKQNNKPQNDNIMNQGAQDNPKTEQDNGSKFKKPQNAQSAHSGAVTSAHSGAVTSNQGQFSKEAMKPAQSNLMSASPLPSPTSTGNKPKQPAYNKEGESEEESSGADSFDEEVENGSTEEEQSGDSIHISKVPINIEETNVGEEDDEEEKKKEDNQMKSVAKTEQEESEESSGDLDDEGSTEDSSADDSDDDSKEDQPQNTDGKLPSNATVPTNSVNTSAPSSSSLQTVNLMAQNMPKMSGNPVGQIHVNGPAIPGPIFMQGGPPPAAKEIVINLRLPIIATTHPQGTLPNNQPMPPPGTAPFQTNLGVSSVKQPMLPPDPGANFNPPKPVLTSPPINLPGPKLGNFTGPVSPMTPGPILPLNPAPLKVLKLQPPNNSAGLPLMGPPELDGLPFTDLPPLGPPIPPALPHPFNNPMNSHPFGPPIFPGAPKPLNGIFNHPGAPFPGPLPSRIASSLRMSPNSPVLMNNRVKSQNKTNSTDVERKPVPNMKPVHGKDKKEKETEEDDEEDDEEGSTMVEKNISKPPQKETKLLKYDSNTQEKGPKLMKDASKVTEKDTKIQATGTKVRPVEESEIQTMNVTYIGDQEQDEESDGMSSSGELDASGNDDDDLYFNEDKDKRKNAQVTTNKNDNTQSQAAQVKGKEQEYNGAKLNVSLPKPKHQKSLMEVNDEDDEGEIMLYTKPTNSMALKSASTNQVQANSLLSNLSANKTASLSITADQKSSTQTNDVNEATAVANKTTLQTTSQTISQAVLTNSSKDTDESKNFSGEKLSDSLDEAQILKIQAMENLANTFDHGEDSYLKDRMNDVKADLDNEREEGELNSKHLFAEKRNGGHIKPADKTKVVASLPPGGMGKPHETGETKATHFENNASLPIGIGKQNTVNETNLMTQSFSGDGAEVRGSGNASKQEYLPGKQTSEIEDSLAGVSTDEQKGETSGMFGEEPSTPKSDKIEGLGGERVNPKKNETFVDDKNMFKPVSSLAPNAKLEAVKEIITRPSKNASPTIRMLGGRALTDEIGDKRDKLRKPTGKSQAQLEMLLGDEFPDGESVSFRQRKTADPVIIKDSGSSPSAKRSDIEKTDSILIGLGDSTKPSDKRSSIPMIESNFRHVANATKRTESPTPDLRLPTSKLKGDKRYMINLAGGDSMGGWDQFFEKDGDDEQRSMYPSNENDEILEAAENELQQQGGENSDDFDGFNAERSSFNYPTVDPVSDQRWSFPVEDSSFSEAGYDPSPSSFTNEKDADELEGKEKVEQKNFSAKTKSNTGADIGDPAESKKSNSFSKGKAPEGPKQPSSAGKPTVEVKSVQEKVDNVNEETSITKASGDVSVVKNKFPSETRKEAPLKQEVSEETDESGSGSGALELSGSGSEESGESGSDASGSGEVVDKEKETSEQTGREGSEASPGNQRSEDIGDTEESGSGEMVESGAAPSEEIGKQRFEETSKTEPAWIKGLESTGNAEGEEAESGSGTTEEEEEKEEVRKRKTEALFDKPLPAVTQTTKSEDTRNRGLYSKPQVGQQNKNNSKPLAGMNEETNAHKQQLQDKQAPSTTDKANSTPSQTISQSIKENQNKTDNPVSENEELTPSADFDDVESENSNEESTSEDSKTPKQNTDQSNQNTQNTKQLNQQVAQQNSNSTAVSNNTSTQSMKTTPSESPREVKSNHQNDTAPVTNLLNQTKPTSSNETSITALNLIKLVNVSAEAFENALSEDESPKKMNDTKASNLSKPEQTVSTNNKTQDDSKSVEYNLKNDTTSILDESILEEIQNATDTLESHEIKFKATPEPPKPNKAKGFAMPSEISKKKNEEVQNEIGKNLTQTKQSTREEVDKKNQASPSLQSTAKTVTSIDQRMKKDSGKAAQQTLGSNQLNQNVNNNMPSILPNIQSSMNVAQIKLPQFNHQKIDEPKQITMNKENKQTKTTSAETEVTEDEQKDEDELADAVISPLFDYSVNANDVAVKGAQATVNQVKGARQSQQYEVSKQEKVKQPKKGFSFPGQSGGSQANKEMGDEIGSQEWREDKKNSKVFNKARPSSKVPTKSFSKPTGRPSPLKVLYFPVTKMKSYGDRKMRGKNAFPLHESKLLKHVSHFHHNKNGEESSQSINRQTKKRKPRDKRKQWKKKWSSHKKKHKKSSRHRTLHPKVQVQHQMDHHTQIMNQKHRHPMEGHRYGGEIYQHTHKMANHDFSAQIGHYGMHDDNYDSHSNDDRFAEMSPDNNETQAIPQQTNMVQPPAPGGRTAVPTQDISSSVLEKINTFNSLAGHLADNLSNFNRGKGWKPKKDPMWKSFMQGQEKLKDLQVERQGVLDNIQSTTDKKTCHRGITVRGATLRGGILSGEFHSQGVVKTQKECVDLCCKSKKCDIAMTVGRECINIKCFNRKNCNVAPAGSHSLYRDVLPVTTFVQHPDDGIDRRSEIPHPLSVVDVVRQLEESEAEEIESLINSVNVYP